MIDQRIRDKFPLFAAYGGKHKFLSHKESIAATPAERIRSIWPFLFDRVMKFDKTLKPRERVNFDAEDTMLELYVTLLVKDSGWVPSKGKYITYAGTIVDRELCSIRDRSRTVESPRNSSGRMKEYLAEEEAGELTARRRITAAQIKGTNCISQIPVAPGDALAPWDSGGDPCESMTTAEKNAVLSEAVSSSIRKALTPYEASVVGKAFGLWGNTPKKTLGISWETAHDPIEVRRAKVSALWKIREYLASINHPAVAVPF